MWLLTADWKAGKHCWKWRNVKLIELKILKEVAEVLVVVAEVVAVVVAEVIVVVVAEVVVAEVIVVAEVA